MSESRLHSSYHKPSVSLMNDIPAELYFDGAGFLRYEDDSEEEKPTGGKKENYGKSSTRSSQDNNKALKEFQDVFNVTNPRTIHTVKFDDEEPYYDAKLFPRGTEDRSIDHGAQGTENTPPVSVDFMSAYQKEMLENLQNYAQWTQNPGSFQQNPFSSVTYPNFYNPQLNFNQMSEAPMVQQEPLLQNHRLQSTPNHASVGSPSVYASSSSQPVNANSGYALNLNYPQHAKIRRKKRSTIDQSVVSASEPIQDHYQYSRPVDQQDSSSGFIPVTGNFNGGAIQLNFPIFSSPLVGNGYSVPSPPMQAYHAYSVPMQPEGRHYRNTMEGFYHPSEARRYSYGILGSGNFEVIRGGVFPNELHQGYSGGYQDGRIPYGDYGNYGTTEIILDGPIQGFQGFDNFPVHLINALSKHSHLAVQPDRRTAKDKS